MINIIVAHGNYREIGQDNDLLWKLPTDMKRFKDLTTGHTVVMGRKTFMSIGQSLPNRSNIVMSRQPLLFEGCSTLTPEYFAYFLFWAKDKEIFIIGGSEVYKAFLPHADRLYITMVEADFPKADTHFPEYIHMLKDFLLVDYQHIRKDEFNPYDTRFVVYEKK